MKHTGINDQALIALTEKAHAEAIATLSPEMLKACEQMLINLEVKMSATMRTTAGKAWVMRHKIEMNWRLLRDKPEDFVSTYKHELAHLVSHAVHGPRFGRGHGAAWRNVMRTMGQEPERCHNLDVSALKRKTIKYLYRCLNKDCKRHTQLFELTAGKHTKAVKNAMRGYTYSYSCPCCRSNLEYTLDTIRS